MVMKTKSRSPCAAIAKAVLKKREQKNGMKANAAKIEAQLRKSGGYGKSMISIWEKPKGGIENSPAYRKLLTRCDLDAKGKPPPPAERDGAPVKGGFPLNKYAPNVIVDGMRASWLPDDWAQVIKNTGPGGTYLGCMSPEGKFFYHRSRYPTAIEESCFGGRKLSVLDGMNGMMRSVRKIVNPGADKAFLQSCLTPKERKCIAPASEFHFGVVSARRANIESGQHDIMTVEGHFKQLGIKPVWYVDADTLADYKKLGLDAKVGGKLTPARNMILDDAKKKKKVCVQISDDISKWTYYDCDKQDFRGETDFKKANFALLGTKKHIVSPLAAAQFMLAKMRADEQKPKLAGVFPTGNAAMTLGSAEFGRHHFILGDFFVAEPSSSCRFDESMTLKEDYDYACSHIHAHGSVLRCNRMFLTVKHSTNEGGAVSERDAKGVKERANIAILQRKWPGVFRMNTNRKDSNSEVVMNWNNYGKTPGAPKVKAEKAAKVGAKVIKHKLKVNKFKQFSPHAVLKFSKQDGSADYMNKRCSRCHGKTVGACLGMMYKDAKGTEKTYGNADLKYDIAGGRLTVVKK
jgi:hypothetical protein